MKTSIVIFHVFSVTVREYKLVLGALLMYCGWWCAQHFTHTALNLQHSPWGGWCLLHFKVKFLLGVCPHRAVPQGQAVRPSGVWGRRPSSLQAFALSPVQRWQPGGLTLLRKAGALLWGLLPLAVPPSVSYHRCLLPVWQQSPLPDGPASPAWGRTLCWPGLPPTALAAGEVQCPVPVWLVCCWEAGQGRRAAGLPAGGAPQVPILKSRPELRVLCLCESPFQLCLCDFPPT